MTYEELKDALLRAGVSNAELFGAPGKPALLAVAQRHGLHSAMRVRGGGCAGSKMVSEGSLPHDPGMPPAPQQQSLPQGPPREEQMDGPDVTAAPTDLSMESVPFVGAVELNAVFDDLHHGKAGCIIPRAELRGITLRQLREVWAHVQRRCEVEGWRDFRDPSIILTVDVVNMYMVDRYVIKPATEARKCAYLELVAAGAQRPDFHLSHWWGLPTKSLLAILEQHAHDRGLGEDAVYWICAFGNNQWDREGSPYSEGSPYLEETSFYKAMKLSRGQLVAVDRGGILMQRIWVVYELYVTYSGKLGRDKLLDIYTAQEHEHGGKTRHAVGSTQGLAADDMGRLDFKAEREMHFPLGMVNQFVQLRLETGQASVEADRVKLLNTITNQPDLAAEPPETHPIYDDFNAFLRGRFAISAIRGAAHACEDLPVAFATLKASRLAHVHLPLQDTEGLDNDAASSLAECLPPEAETVQIHIERTGVGEKGAAALVRACMKLPRIVHLRLAGLPGSALQLLADANATTMSRLEVLDCRDASLKSTVPLQKLEKALSGNVLTKLKTINLTSSGEMPTSLITTCAARKNPILLLSDDSSKRFRRDVMEKEAFNAMLQARKAAGGKDISESDKRRLEAEYNEAAQAYSRLIDFQDAIGSERFKALETKPPQKCHPTQHRSMTLAAMRRVKAHVARRCVVEQWTGWRLQPNGSWAEVALTPETVNLYDLDDRMIRPATAKYKCSWVHLLTDDVISPTFFCSHFWGEPVVDFVECLEAHARDRLLDADKDAYWICAYGNNQWDLGDDVTKNPDESSFRRAMQLPSCRGTISIVDLGALTFTRIWCVYEIFRALTDEGKIYDAYTAISRGQAVGVTDGIAEADHGLVEFKLSREAAFPTSTVCHALQQELHKGDASYQTDKTHILNCIIGRKGDDLELEPLPQHEMYDYMNTKLHGKFSAATYLSSVLDDTPSVKSLFSSALATAPLPQLALSFDRIAAFTDAEAIRLAEKLPQTLEVLVISCQGSSVTARGVDALAKVAAALPKLKHARIHDAQGALTLSMSHAP